MNYSIADELIKLKQLLDAGVLSQSEFDMQKQKLFDLQDAGNVDESGNYSIMLVYFPDKARSRVVDYLKEILLVDDKKARDLTYNLPVSLRSNVQINVCHEMETKFSQIGAITQIYEDNPEYHNNDITPLPPKCPRCGSTSITTTARGVNLTWGLLGASKTVNRCANCGHTWRPKG